MEPTLVADVAVRNWNYNIKPAQVADEDNDFPEFEFPVSSGVGTLDAWKAVSTAGQDVQTGNGNSAWGFLQPGGAFCDESPKKMPLAFHSNHVEGVLDLNPCFPSLVTEPTTKQCLSPVIAYKNLDLSHEDSKVDVLGDDFAAVPSTPTGKSFNTKSKQTRDPVAAAVPSTPVRKSSSNNTKVAKSPTDAVKTPERPRWSGPLGKVPGGLSRLTTPRERNEPLRALSPTPDRRSLTAPRGREFDPGRVLSSTPDRRSLTSPRRIPPERSRSPVPFQTPGQGNYGVNRALAPSLASPRSVTPPRGFPPARSITPTRSLSTPRSTSPVSRVRQEQYSNLPKEQWQGSTVNTTSMPSSPRYITPTRAASLKSVKSPANPNACLSKELQFPTAPGNATLYRDPVKRASKEANSKIGDDALTTSKGKSSPPLTQPIGFNFKTDERLEKRRDFYAKLEEKTKALEEEKKRLEAKAQEEKEAQLRELRKSLTYKANPVPKFYQEPPPPPVEIKKTPPTRARSPNFTAPRRRSTCMGSFSESSSSGSSPLRGRLIRSPSLESNSDSSHARVSPKTKLPFKPI